MNSAALRVYSLLPVLGLVTVLGGFPPAGTRSDNNAGEPVGRLFQVVLNVKDMDAQVRFYRDVLGFTVIYPDTADDLGSEPFVRLDTGGAHLALHAGRTAANNRQEPRLSFMTDDIHVTQGRLQRQGLQLAPIRSPAPGVLVIDTQDPEGNTFHLEARVPADKATPSADATRYRP